MKFPSFFRQRWFRRLAVLTLILIVLASLAITWNGVSDDLQKADLAVVLGNKVQQNGQPSRLLKARLDQAVKVYQGGYCPLILVSGGHGKEGYDEPVVMRAYLESHGIPGAAIYEDNGGDNTWGTARDTAIFMQDHHLHSVIIVSSYFHITRCRLAFHRFGLTTVYSSHAPYWRLRDFYSLPREIVGCVGYYFRPLN